MTIDSATRRSIRAHIRAAAEPAVERAGCELVAVELGTAAGRGLVRLVIDKPGGVGVGDCATVSRAVSPALDASDPYPGPYHLEVSSPGIDRPVERREDFQRYAGRAASVRVAGSRRPVQGTLRGLDGDTLMLEVAGQVRELALQDVDRVRLSPLQGAPS
jgi:ribosome maturation factor RimP